MTECSPLTADNPVDPSREPAEQPEHGELLSDGLSPGVLDWPGESVDATPVTPAALPGWLAASDADSDSEDDDDDDDLFDDDDDEDVFDDDDDDFDDDEDEPYSDDDEDDDDLDDYFSQNDDD